MTDFAPGIEYLADERVSDADDRQIRALLTACFTGPQDAVFQTQRYFNEPYPNRWVIRDAFGAIVAHVGVHEKALEVGGAVYRFGGIAEVCVHPDHRGKGYVKRILAVVHAWLAERGFAFSVLFGTAAVYGSSGYVSAGNVYCREAPGREPRLYDCVFVKQLTDATWPAEVTLPGYIF